MKKWYAILTLLFIITGCGTLKEESIQKVKVSINEMEDAIRKQNKAKYERYSRVEKFYDFFSFTGNLTQGAAQNQFSLDFVSAKGNDKKIKAQVKFDVNLAGLISSLNNGEIPQETLQGLNELGLPDTLYITFIPEGDYYVADSITFPVKYFYLNLLLK